MSEKSQVIKAAGVVGAATLLSRMLGYIRDAVIAWYFGAGLNSDAFIAAFRIPNLLRKLLGEGSISNAFVKPSASQDLPFGSCLLYWYWFR
jgi:putative peptidoglycan lipid II flippase